MSTGSRRIDDLQEVNILDDKDQFIFFQNSTKRTKRITKGNMAISGGGIRGKFIDAATGNDVGITSATAAANAATALNTANNAQTSADGKAKVYYQTSQPTGGTYNAGDLWYDTDDNYKLYVRSGGTWTASFSPMLKLDGNNNVSGLQKVGGIDKAFVLVAADFQIWNGTSADVPFEVVTVGGSQVVRIKNAQIQTVDAGKLTAGFISSQVLELANSDAYFQSSTFIETWVSGKLYKTTKTVPSDVIKVKVLQTDGSFKVYNCNTQHTSSGASFPGPDSGKWTEVSVPTVSVDTGNGSTSIPDFGFRIVGNGQGEFGGGLFRGAVIAQEGFFGTTKNAVRIDSDGMQIGGSGRIKSSSVSWSGAGTGAFSGNGFFLGYTGGQYQFYIGDTSTNYLRWDGSALKINGNLLSGTTLGTNGDSSFGLTVNSQFGIRRSVANSVLTISGGDGNGVQYGAQIDLVGGFLNTTGSDTGNGQLILQAAYNASNNFNGPQDGSIVFRTSKFTTVSSADVGIMRMLIALDGTVLIGKGDETAASGAPDAGSGKLIVSNTITAGGDDLFGNNSNGIIYVKNNSNVAKITITASSGDVTADTFTTSSSKKFKTNIKQLNSGIETIYKLKPVSFKRKGTRQQDIGLIAEEVDKVLPVIVKHNDKNEAEGLDYSKLTVILINAVKELSAEVKELKKKLKDAN
jgi:hypothetical protein